MLVGKQFPVKEGLRVVMAPGLPDKGTGTIKALLDGGARVSVKWDDSGIEETISTGDGGNYDLAAATRAQDTPSVASMSIGYDRGLSTSMGYDQKSYTPVASTGYEGGVATPAGYTQGLSTSVGYMSIAEEPGSARTPGQASVGYTSVLGDARTPAASVGGYASIREDSGTARSVGQGSIASASKYRSAASPAAPALLQPSQRSALSSSQTSLFTSQRQQSHATTNGVPEAGSFRNTLNRSTQGSFRAGSASRLTAESTGSVGGSDALHKQLLAQEVVKLRKELDELRAAKAQRSAAASTAANSRAAGADAVRQELLSRLRRDIERLEDERDSAVAQATQQKGALAQEVKALRDELEESRREGEARNDQLERESILSTPVGQALAQRREFEERFTHALRDLRAQLESSSIKALSMSSDAPVGIRSLLHHSNARIDGALEDATRIPVEERLHIECLRIVIENGKIRKALNEYAQGVLDNALVKEGFQPRVNTQGGMFTTTLGGGSFFSSLFV